MTIRTSWRHGRNYFVWLTFKPLDGSTTTAAAIDRRNISSKRKLSSLLLLQLLKMIPDIKKLVETIGWIIGCWFNWNSATEFDVIQTRTEFYWIFFSLDRGRIRLWNCLATNYSNVDRRKLKTKIFQIIEHQQPTHGIEINVEINMSFDWLDDLFIMDLLVLLQHLNSKSRAVHFKRRVTWLGVEEWGEKFNISVNFYSVSSTY